METATANLVQFEVETRDMGAFTAEFARLVKKAAKLGVTAPTYTVLQRDKVYPAVVSETGQVKKAARRVNVISVSGQAPRLAGWTFLAALQHEAEGNIVRTIPGVNIAARKDLRTAGPDCEHCNVHRRRNDTYIVVHDDGRQMQVGRQCLADFTGHDSPEAIARWAELLHAFRESIDSMGGDGEGYGGGQRQVTTLDDFLPYVVASIRADGWLSRTAARESYGARTATADLAWLNCFPPPNKTLLVPSDDDLARSRTCLETLRNHFDANPAETLTDYEHNCRIVVEGLSVDSRSAGIAASLVAFADRLLGQEIERRKNAVSEHVGTVGKRETFTLSVERIVDIEGAYGTTHLTMFRDEKGNSYKWFASSVRLDVGSTYTVKATVKAHDVYNGTKQTTLTRCKAEKVEAEGVAA